MILTVDDNMTIADLQEKFSECFPHLKLVFYSHPHHRTASVPENEIIDPSKKLSEVRNKHEHGSLVVKSWYQTGRVEKDFKKLFGLNVQILRNKDGD